MNAVATREMTRRDDAAVKISADIVKKAKVVAADREIPLAQYLSEVLAPIVDHDYKEQARKALGGDSPPPKPKR